MKRALATLRWLLVVPAAIVAAIGAHAGMVLLWGITTGLYVDPEGWLSRGYLFILANAIAGFAAVHAAHRVAPSHKSIGALLGLTGVVLLAGMGVVGIIMAQTGYKDLAGLGLTLAGAIFGAVSLIDRQSPTSLPQGVVTADTADDPGPHTL